MIKGGEMMPECRKKYCTEHFDTTGCFLVISLDKKNREKKHFAVLPPPPFPTETGRIHSYVLQVRIAEGAPSGAGSETVSSLCRDNKTVEASEDNIVSPLWGSYTGPQSLEQDGHDFRALEGRFVAEMRDEIHSASGRHSRIFTNAKLFVTGC